MTAIPQTNNAKIMKTKDIFGIAALAIMMAACSSDDTTEPQPSQNGKAIPFRATISAPAATRGLTAPTTEGGDITAKWEVGEKIALVHGATINVLKVTTQPDTDGNVTVEGTVTDFPESATDGETAYLVYYGNDEHIADDMGDQVGMLTNALDAAGAKTFTPEIIAETFSICSQGGTLEDISLAGDYRLGQSKLVKKGDYVTLNDTPTLDSQFAVWQLKLTSDGSTALPVKNFAVKNASSELITVSLGESTSSSLYLLFPVSTNATFTFEGEDANSVVYDCTKTGITLSKGKFYQSTLTLNVLSAVVP